MKAEERTAQTLLEQEKEVIVGGKKYYMAPPTIATLSLASAEIGKLPIIDKDLKGEEMLYEALKYARNGKTIVEIATILIMGAKKYLRHRKCIFRTKTDRLRKALSNESPKKLDEVIGLCLMSMQIHDFFLLTTFLSNVNLTRPTK